jgi:hypothetical protein
MYIGSVDKTGLPSPSQTLNFYTANGFSYSPSTIGSDTSGNFVFHPFNGLSQFTGTLGASTLAGSTTQCIQADTSGHLSGTGAACGSGGVGSAFSALNGGTNTSAAMTVGSGASLGVTGTGTIAATSIGGVTVTGTPSTGQVIKATGSSTATWQSAGGGGVPWVVDEFYAPVGGISTGGPGIGIFGWTQHIAGSATIFAYGSPTSAIAS